MSIHVELVTCLRSLAKLLSESVRLGLFLARLEMASKTTDHLRKAFQKSKVGLLAAAPESEMQVFRQEWLLSFYGIEMLGMSSACEDIKDFW